MTPTAGDRRSVAEAVDRLIYYTSECRNLVKRCDQLRVETAGLEEWATIDEVNMAIRRVYGRIFQWAVDPDIWVGIREDMDESYRELDAISLLCSLELQKQAQRPHPVAIRINMAADESPASADSIDDDAMSIKGLYLQADNATQLAMPRSELPDRVPGHRFVDPTPPDAPTEYSAARYPFATRPIDLRLPRGHLPHRYHDGLDSASSAVFTRSASSSVTAPSIVVASPWSGFSASPVKSVMETNSMNERTLFYHVQPWSTAMLR